MNKKDFLAKRGSTMFLRAAVVAMGLVGLGLCALIMPAVFLEWPKEFPETSYLRYPVLLALAGAATAFWAVLYQTLKLLNYIDKNKAFSKLSVKVLGKIKYFALLMSGFLLATMPLVYAVAEQDDAPGLILIGLGFALAPVVIAVFAAVCQRLLHDAIAIKSENDLTV